LIFSGKNGSKERNSKTNFILDLSKQNSKKNSKKTSPRNENEKINDTTRFSNIREVDMEDSKKN